MKAEMTRKELEDHLRKRIEGDKTINPEFATCISLEAWKHTKIVTMTEEGSSLVSAEKYVQSRDGIIEFINSPFSGMKGLVR